jgi:hypothetical protein
LGCDREQSFLMPPSLDGWLPHGSLRAVRDRDGRGDGSGRVLYRLPRRWSWPSGARSGDVGRAVGVRLLAWPAVLAGDRAWVHRGRRVSGDRRQPPARSLHDRAVSSAPRGGAGRPVRRGARAVCHGGADRGQGVAVDGTKVHTDASERATRDYEQLALASPDLQGARAGQSRRPPPTCPGPISTAQAATRARSARTSHATPARPRGQTPSTISQQPPWKPAVAAAGSSPLVAGGRGSDGFQVRTLGTSRPRSPAYAPPLPARGVPRFRWSAVSVRLIAGAPVVLVDHS